MWTMPKTPAPAKPKKGDHVFLVDGSSYIFRAYWQSMNQDAKYNRRSDGVPTGAVRMFCIMLWRILAEMKPEDQPTHLAVVFDKSEKTFRTELYPDYKAHRPDPPDDLRPQFPLIRDAVRAFDLPSIEMGGYEADDLIATYVREARAVGATVTIVASDKDLMQLVGDGVVMYDTMKDRRIGVPEVIEKFGVPPNKVIDVQALIGDSTDNVPGVPGIGPKTAAELIQQYDDLETLLLRTSEIKQEKRRQALIDNADKARLSKQLVTLDDHVKLEVPLADLAVHQPDYKRLVAFLKAMEFTTLVRRIAEACGIDASEIESDPAVKAGAIPLRRDADMAAVAQSEPVPASVAEPTTLPLTGGRMNRKPVAKGGDAGAKPGDFSGAPQAVVDSRTQAARKSGVDRTRYEIVRDVKRLKEWVARAQDLGVVAIDTETSTLDPMQATLCGFSLAVAPNEACYVPLAHRVGGEKGSLFAGDLAPEQMPEPDALAALKPLLEDRGVLKIGQNLKFDWQIFALRGIELGPYDDTMLMSYVLDAGRSDHGLDPLSMRYFDHITLDYNEVTKVGKSRLPFEAVEISKATEYAAEDADVTLRLWHVLKPRLVAEGMTSVYETLERPLLAGAGPHGAARHLDRPAGAIAACRATLRNAPARSRPRSRNWRAGRSIPAAPSRSSDFLFGKLQLPGAKKTKTGAWSTSASVLDELAEAGHELPQRILDWRQITKLKSTYTDALPGFVNPTTHRVHTSYALASTTTGRLSSSEPNLQNIPIRTEEGRKIRRAFIADPERNSSPPTTRRSSCGCSPRSPIFRSCGRPSATGSTFTR